MCPDPEWWLDEWNDDPLCLPLPECDELAWLPLADPLCEPDAADDCAVASATPDVFASLAMSLWTQTPSARYVFVPGTRMATVQADHPYTGLADEPVADHARWSRIRHARRAR